ncbi:MAG: SpoIIE family protein phosphatase [Planctomycetes bacterium]|nr:SpoIIE family protein phosphatase [Planctomycetota bacterium]
MARLVVTAGPDRGLIFHLAATALIGRGGQGHTGLSDEAVAARHVVLKQIEGEYYLARADPHAAVVLNGRPVERARLKDGDEIGIGRTTLRFQGGAAATAAAPAPPVAPAGATSTQIQKTQQVFKDADGLLASFVGRAGRGDQSRLETIYKVSTAIGAIADHDQLLDRLLEIIFEQLPAERGFVLLDDAGDGRFRVDAARDRRAGRLEVPPQVSTTIIKEVVRRREAVLCMDASQDARFSHGQSVARLSLRSVMAVPLLAGERVAGVIEVDSSLATKAFTQDDLEMLNGIALQASIALERFRLQAEKAEKDRMESEMHQAGEVQQFLMPRRLPAIPGVSFGFSYALSQGLGGDYYDFIQVDPDRLAMVVGDVSGHNISSALIMAMCRSVIRQLLETEASPAEVMARANRQLEADTPPGMFVTAFLGILDLSTFGYTYCNAGHNYPLVFRGAAGTPETLRMGGLALGMMPRSRYRQDTVRLGPRDALVLYTDGIVEAHGTDGSMLGDERFVQSLGRHLGQDPQEVASRAVADLHAFCGGKGLEDDLTLIVAQVDERYGYDRFDLTATAAHVGPSVERVLRFAGERGFASAAGEIRAAVGAALDNAVRHGAALDPALAVGVRARVGTGRLAVTVSDPGGGFDHRARRRRATAGGIGAMVSAAARVEWNDAGNAVTLDFELSDDRPSA